MTLCVRVLLTLMLEVRLAEVKGFTQHRRWWTEKWDQDLMACLSPLLSSSLPFPPLSSVSPLPSPLSPNSLGRNNAFQVKAKFKGLLPRQELIPIFPGLRVLLLYPREKMSSNTHEEKDRMLPKSALQQTALPRTSAEFYSRGGLSTHSGS